jgi:hypothetical protein
VSAKPVEYIMHIETPAKMGEYAEAGVFFSQDMIEKIVKAAKIPIAKPVIKPDGIKIKAVFSRRFYVIDGEVESGFPTLG